MRQPESLIIPLYYSSCLHRRYARKPSSSHAALSSAYSLSENVQSNLSSTSDVPPSACPVRRSSSRSLGRPSSSRALRSFSLSSSEGDHDEEDDNVFSSSWCMWSSAEGSHSQSSSFCSSTRWPDVGALDLRSSSQGPIHSISPSSNPSRQTGHMRGSMLSRHL